MTDLLIWYSPQVFIYGLSTLALIVGGRVIIFWLKRHKRTLSPADDRDQLQIGLRRHPSNEQTIYPQVEPVVLTM